MPGTDIQKRRRIRFIIFSCLCLIPALTYLETRIFQIGTVSFPVSGNVLVFVLININVLLLLLMVFLTLRNIVELVFARKRKFLGTGLRIKLVISFVSLSLIPTGLLFFISLQFVSTSMDYWFNSNVEQSLLESLTIAKQVYNKAKEQVVRQGKLFSSQLVSERYKLVYQDDVNLFFADLLESYDLAALELISEDRTIAAQAFGAGFGEKGKKLPEIPPQYIRRAFAGEGNLVVVQPVPDGELVRSVIAAGSFSENMRREILVTSLLISHGQLDKMKKISNGLEGYRQLMFLKAPIKTSLLILLLIVTLMIIFCAIWFGFYVARGLTGPIGKLGEATRRVAEGDLDFVLEKESGDEMGTLVDSFNRMTRDLLLGKQQLEKTNLALKDSYQELDERSRYTEIILQNVAAGVISIDNQGRIATINRFAEELLDINNDEIVNSDYQEVLQPEHLEILNVFLAELNDSIHSTIQRPLRLSIGDEAISLRVNFTRLEDEEHNRLGVVLVFDNLTELEKAQRMAAWREVARRIAHEVKNPLTPISLSAQRLRRKYLSRLESEKDVFDLCTKTIINQVDELKRLVSEFSNFARMPTVRKTMSSLPAMVREVLVLYEAAHKNIDFEIIGDDIVDFSFDLKQMERVLINLIDNAVAVLPDKGKIDVCFYVDEDQKLVFMEVNDNGPGVKDEDKLRLFEPYFSTKKTGTGLGLAIASTVVTDHGGYIRVKDNPPHGAKFVVELPFAQ
jgi:two-component system, NtrC family, nitrogen regulation sensor histidine kinase NtrY